MRRNPIIFLLLAVAVYVGVARGGWHGDARVRTATALVAATLVLWVSEAAPLGVTALGIPIAATLSGVLGWQEAVSVWGDPVIFLNLGAFLLARALDKHGAFAWVATSDWLTAKRRGPGPSAVVLAVSGTLSTVQNNTAVTAMLLPAVTLAARRAAAPAAVLMALSLGATLGGMATPIGTAPNFLGYSRMRALDSGTSFLSWMRVGLVVWVGASAIAWAVLALAERISPRAGTAERSEGRLEAFVETDVGPMRDAAEERDPPRRIGRRVALLGLAVAALLWLVPGVVKGIAPKDAPVCGWVERYLPESFVPIAVCWLMFLIPTGDGKRVLDRHDFQSLDWDTLFLFGGGLCLGKALSASGADMALANAVGAAGFPPLPAMIALALATVLLSEMTSNTATAVLMVPVAAPLSAALGLSGAQATMLVALCASLGFALPVSTPPNALVYSTRRVPLRFMAATGLAVDLLATGWVVACVVLLG